MADGVEKKASETSAPPRPTPKKKRKSHYFESSDRGNAERLAAVCRGRIYYVERWRKWIVWTGKCWQPDDAGTRIKAMALKAVDSILEEAKKEEDQDRKKALLKWKRASGDARRIFAMIEICNALPGMCISHDKLDQKPWLLNCKNGVLDLTTGKLQKHAPGDLLTKVIDVNFNAKAKAPLFEKFMATVLPDRDVRDFLQRFAGYCATGDVSERMFVVLHGGGRNGKSVFLRCLQKALGPYAKTAAPGLLMAKQQDSHPAELADLYGARVALASEIRKGRTFDEEAVKRLTGNDRLKARFMREDWWEYDPYFKLLIAANHKPKVKDTSDSFWDRIAFIPFNVRITDKQIDRKLPSKLEKTGELEGVLNWIIKGCVAWQKDGLKVPETVKAATKAYREAEDIVGRFLSEKCVIDAAAAVLADSPLLPTSDLISAGRRWCEANGLMWPFTEKDLAERLGELGAVPGRSKHARGWRGVTLLQPVRKVVPPRGISPTSLQVTKKPTPASPN